MTWASGSVHALPCLARIALFQARVCKWQAAQIKVHKAKFSHPKGPFQPCRGK